MKSVVSLVFFLGFPHSFLRGFEITVNLVKLKLIKNPAKEYNSAAAHTVFLENSCTTLPTPAPAFMYQWQPVIHIGISPKKLPLKGPGV